LLFQTEAQKEKSTGSFGWYTRHKLYSSFKFNLALYLGVAAFFLIIGAIVEFATPPPEPFYTTNKCVSREIYVVIVEVVVIVVSAIALITKLWHADDAFYFKFELKLGLCLCVPSALLWGIYMTTNIFPSYFRSSWFVMLSIICGYIPAIVLPVFLSYFRPQVHRLKRSESTTGSTFSIVEKDRMLECVMDQELFELFKARCLRAWCVENLLFYKTVMDFKNSFFSLASEQRKTQAQEIYEMFIKPESNLEVNLDSQTREGVAELLESNISITSAIFDDPLNTVSTMLRFGVFREWALSEEFRRRFPEDYLSKPDGHKSSMQSTTSGISTSSESPLQNSAGLDIELKSAV